MKKILLFALLLFGLTQPAGAVLNEKDLNHSLRVLRAELTQAYEKQKETMAHLKDMNITQHRKMLQTMQKNSQISLMIYSQKDDYTFDLNYACHEASEQYRLFKTSRFPYDNIEQRLKIELKRYDGLIRSLQQLPPAIMNGAAPPPPAAGDSTKAKPQPPKPGDYLEKFVLNDEGQKDRAVCLDLAKKLRENVIEMQEQIADDRENYVMLEKHMAELNEYAKQRYRDIQQNVFENSSNNYF